MREAQRISIWEGEFEDELPYPAAILVREPLELLTAEVDALLLEWDREGPVSHRLLEAISAEHDARVLRAVGVERAKGRSLGRLVEVLRIKEKLKPSLAMLPPAAYRARRLGRPDPGGTWHRATVSRILQRYEFAALLADTRQALARIVRETVPPHLYSGRGLDWVAGYLNRLGVPTERQTRLELAGFEPGRQGWRRGDLKAFLFPASPDSLQAREPGEWRATIWRRHVVASWSKGVGAAEIAETLNGAGVLTPSQLRDHCEGQRLPKPRWSAAIVRGLAVRLGKHLAWSGQTRDAHRAACRARITPLRAAGLSGRAIAEALNAAGILTPSQQRARDQGRAPPAVRWSCGSVLRLAA